MSNIQEINKENFEEVVIKSQIPVLIDFSTPWCGPCRKLTPVLEQIQNEFSNEIKIVKINADENIDIVQEYGVSSFPTIIILKNKEVKEFMAGSMSKSAIVSNIKKHI